MPRQPISRGAARGLIRFILVGLAVLIAMWGYILYQSYQGRVDLIHAERKACGLGKRDRIANAKGWRAAEVARLDAFMSTEHLTTAEAHKILFQKRKPDDPPDLVAAWKYDRIANGLEERGRINCVKAFPSASFLP